MTELGTTTPSRGPPRLRHLLRAEVKVAAETIGIPPTELRDA